LWELDGVHSTAVGYVGGYTPNPTYEEGCSGRTGHTEVVRVVYEARVIPYGVLLGQFWETQGMRQGNDRGTRSDSRRKDSRASNFATGRCDLLMPAVWGGHRLCTESGSGGHWLGLLRIEAGDEPVETVDNFPN
jgi:Peptide methionine sulfoxide reductase